MKEFQHGPIRARVTLNPDDPDNHDVVVTNRHGAIFTLTTYGGRSPLQDSARQVISILGEAYENPEELARRHPGLDDSALDRIVEGAELLGPDILTAAEGLEETEAFEEAEEEESLERFWQERQSPEMGNGGKGGTPVPKYNVVITAEAEKALKKLPKNIQKAMQDKMEQLRAYPEVSGVKRMWGKAYGKERLKFWDWRMEFKVDENARTITVEKIGHRDTMYDEYH